MPAYLARDASRVSFHLPPPHNNPALHNRCGWVRSSRRARKQRQRRRLRRTENVFMGSNRMIRTSTFCVPATPPVYMPHMLIHTANMHAIWCIHAVPMRPPMAKHLNFDCTRAAGLYIVGEYSSRLARREFSRHFRAETLIRKFRYASSRRALQTIRTNYGGGNGGGRRQTE